MIPADILETLDVVGVGWEPEADGIIPRLPDAFYERLETYSESDVLQISKAVSAHVKAFSRKIMNDTLTLRYGKNWRSLLAYGSPTQKMVARAFLNAEMRQANLADYIRGAK